MQLHYPDCESIVDMYTDSIRAMYNMTPGQTRGAKAVLVENIVDGIVSLAWQESGGEAQRLKTQRRTREIVIEKNYVKNLTSKILRNHIQQNKGKYVYQVELDRAIEIDSKLVVAIECKSYIENAMLKRTLKDFELIARLLYPDLIFCVFQLENSLGGDYGDIGKLVQLGSESTHTLLSHTPDVHLEIITLLDGDRKSSKPIHKPEYFKKLSIKNVEISVHKFQTLLKPFI